MELKFGLPVRVEAVKAAGDAWEVSGYASTFGNTDLGNDVVMPGAFDRTLADGHSVKFLHSHDPRLVLGKPTTLKSDKKGLFGTFKLSKTQLGADTHELLKDGALDSFSIGYMAREYDFTDSGEVRQLTDIELLEVSVVAMPMNPLATVTNVKDFLSLPLADQARQLNDFLGQFLERSTALVATLADGERPLTEAKRREYLELLETFSSLDAVRSDLQRLVALAPGPSGASVRVQLELARKRHRLAGHLQEITA